MTKKEVLEIIKKAAEEKATSLSLMGMELKEVPPDVWQLTSLTDLALSNNLLKKTTARNWIAN